MPQPLTIVFTDGQGASASTRLWLRDGTDLPDVDAFLAGLRSTILPLSNASIVGATYVYSRAFSGTPAASTESNVYRRGLLLFRDTGEARTVSIPSIVENAAETTGPYQGIRITPLTLDPIVTLTDLEDLLTVVVDRWGQPWPLTFIVGGITLQQL